MKTMASRRFQFCAGHRVNKHESKCRNLHGHNYVVLITAEGIERELDPLGRVIDFSVLKKMAYWCEENWDHGFLFHEEDYETQTALNAMNEQKRYAMKENPTAENMALHLLHDIAPILFTPHGVRVTKVVVWETENCYAEASL